MPYAVRLQRYHLPSVPVYNTRNAKRITIHRQVEP